MDKGLAIQASSTTIAGKYLRLMQVSKCMEPLSGILAGGYFTPARELSGMKQVAQSLGRGGSSA